MKKSTIKKETKSKINISKTKSKDKKTKIKTTDSQKIVITAALPYANGPIHIGHLLEYIQADIYARFLKLNDKDVLYICASDMHGTPIEVNAKKAGVKPETFVEKYWKEHQQDFASFLIKFDNYYKTHSPENKELAEHFFAELKKQRLIYTKAMDVIYCNHCQRSLPDRFVRGTCPLCGIADQYGDVCEGCGVVLKGTDLLNPKCSECGNIPIVKQSTHYFFKLSAFASRLKTWINSKEADLQPEVKNWLKEWLDKGLEDWCISRDAPYFGFEIPDSKKECGEVKYFYVWLDAPIGYISSTKNYCDKKNNKTKNCKWEEYWKKGSVQHFIGKDISYFHFLFWPAMLMAMNIPLPKLTVHGFITVDGQKMSKSRGTFFTAKDFHKLYGAEALRFYYASHLDRKVVDVDLNFADFKAVINNVLVGNLGNFCYRALTFAEKNYGTIKTLAAEEKLERTMTALTGKIHTAYRSQDFKSAVKSILTLSDIGNSYFQQAEPWKDPAKHEQQVAWCVNVARNLAIIVNPILPEFSAKVFAAFGENGRQTEVRWTDIGFTWKGKLQKIVKLVEKIEELPQEKAFPLKLVVGEIKSVKDHPNADSLYLLTVDLGKKYGQKQVVAGLKKYLPKKKLEGRKVVFCVNIIPATIRGEKSEAMVLAADDGSIANVLDVVKTNVGEEVHFEGLKNSSKEISFDEFTKIKMEIIKGNVVYEGKKLVSGSEAVTVTGVKDLARVR